MAREERGEQRKIVTDNLQVAVDELLAMAESQGGKKFAWGAGADGGVVL